MSRTIELRLPEWLQDTDGKWACRVTALSGDNARVAQAKVTAEQYASPVGRAFIEAQLRQALMSSYPEAEALK